MFKENRYIFQQPDSGRKTDVLKGLKGVATHDTEATAVGFMGGKPSPIDKFIDEGTKLQQSDPEGIIAKVKNAVLNTLKLPTTVVRGVLEPVHGASKWTTLQIKKGIQQTRNLVATVLAAPVKVWEVTSGYGKKAIDGIIDTIQNSIGTALGKLPTVSHKAAPA